MKQLFWMGVLALCAMFLLVITASFFLEKFAPEHFWDKLEKPLLGGKGRRGGEHAQQNH